MKIRKTSTGFTIIELMVATTVFSVILVIVTFGLIQIGRVYNRGITNSRTQEVARGIMDEVTQSVQFNGGTVQSISHGSSGTIGYCIGARRYSVRLGRMFTETPGDHGLITDTLPGTCSPTTQAVDLSLSDISTASSYPQELLLPNMRVSNLSITPLSNNLYSVNLKVAYGFDDLLNSPTSTNPTCKDGLGRQFCTILSLDTVVQKRVE